MTDNNIQPWDTLRIGIAGGMTAVAIRVYESGNIKVRCPSGHIIIVTPDKVIANYGYIPSEYDEVLRLFTSKDKPSDTNRYVHNL